MRVHATDHPCLLRSLRMKQNKIANRAAKRGLAFLDERVNQAIHPLHPCRISEAKIAHNGATAFYEIEEDLMFAWVDVAHKWLQGAPSYTETEFVPAYQASLGFRDLRNSCERFLLTVQMVGPAAKARRPIPTAEQSTTRRTL